MAYRSRGGYRARASSGYSRRGSAGNGGYRLTGRRAAAPRRRSVSRKPAARQQIVRLVIEQAPASGISRANDRILTKMNPPPGKAKM